MLASVGRSSWLRREIRVGGRRRCVTVDPAADFPTSSYPRSFRFPRVDEPQKKNSLQGVHYSYDWMCIIGEEPRLPLSHATSSGTWCNWLVFNPAEQMPVAASARKLSVSATLKVNHSRGLQNGKLSSDQ